VVVKHASGRPTASGLLLVKDVKKRDELDKLLARLSCFVGNRMLREELITLIVVELLVDKVVVTSGGLKFLLSTREV
jgi:hypothetical protein